MTVYVLEKSSLAEKRYNEFSFNVRVEYFWGARLGSDDFKRKK